MSIMTCDTCNTLLLETCIATQVKGNDYVDGTADIFICPKCGISEAGLAVVVGNLNKVVRDSA